jgi:hypothetical protein
LPSLPTVTNCNRQLFAGKRADCKAASTKTETKDKVILHDLPYNQNKKEIIPFLVLCKPCVRDFLEVSNRKISCKSNSSSFGKNDKNGTSIFGSAGFCCIFGYGFGVGITFVF